MQVGNRDSSCRQPVLTCRSEASSLDFTRPVILRFLRPYIEALSIVAGISFPFIAVSACDASYGADISTFVRWAEHLGNGSPSVYGTGANYPVFGVLTSAGAVGWLQHHFASANVHSTPSRPSVSTSLAGMRFCFCCSAGSRHSSGCACRGQSPFSCP
jgi:hypothetical protein